jgi:hypothetical protein
MAEELEQQVQVVRVVVADIGVHQILLALELLVKDMQVVTTV